MSILGFLKKQLIDVLEWNEVGDEILAWRYPMQDNEIQNGGKLTVREGQRALFVNEGRVADQFGPGLYTLTTKNLPLLTDLMNIAKGFESPFKSDVVFFSTREKIDQKWGTPQPITVNDKQFGAIRLRAFGSFSYTISDVDVFYKKLSGARDLYSIQDLDGQLRSAISMSLATFFGKSEIGFVEMAGNQTAFSELLKTAMKDTFAQYGLSVATFFVQSVSLPEEVQAYLDKASSMRVVGDLRNYAQFQTAEAIGTAAANPGGMGGIGAGLGAGAAIGQAMMGAFSQANASSSSASSGGSGSEEVLETIAKLHDLVGKGILTQAEFDTKKAELLKKIT